VGTRREASRLVADAAGLGGDLGPAVERLLAAACGRLGVGWTAYGPDQTSCVAHGALVIGYGRRRDRPAAVRARVGECAARLAVEEGRAAYALLAWDPAGVSFGSYADGGVSWEPPRAFDLAAAERVLAAMGEAPLVHPRLLGELVGPGSAPGTALVPAFFAALTTEPGSVSRASFREWRRLFGQVVGIPPVALRTHLRDLGVQHGQSYQDDPAAYLFALNTYIALVAKLVAALALPAAAVDVAQASVPVVHRMKRLESGQPFRAAGVANMLDGDVFSWYADDPAWPSFAGPVEEVIERLRRVSFEVSGARARDLFKGLYMTFAPRALRHALGEFYTPDWLAGHTLDVAGWRPEQSLLDPTCGTGTFVLEGLRRRLDATPGAGPAELLAGLRGLDLNPLAVLAARASLVVSLASRLRTGAPVELPVHLADAMRPAVDVPPADLVVGNPPWVKWSNLPPEYAASIRPRCLELGIVADSAWVGGTELDLSAVITYQALERYCAPGGTLAFVITGTVFSTGSGQGFRRWQLPGGEPVEVSTVEDFAAVEPFEGVSNHATLLVLRRRGRPTSYPVPYVVWTAPRRAYADAAVFRAAGAATHLVARPVPGTGAGPWLKGTPAQLNAWSRLFGAGEPAYRARKGITTDANGVFFVRVTPSSAVDTVTVANDPSLGRRDLARASAEIEAGHVFPLLRGKGVAPFRATPDPDHAVLVPQRGMHGEPDLPSTAPRTHAYLSRFQTALESRSSYRRFQRGRPWWSLWSTGAYTFAPYKVVWREMSGGRFAAAYVGTQHHPVLGERVVVPDHKVYFVPLDTEAEAAYLTGLLNAPLVATAVAAYAAALSLGASVVEYLRIPPYDPANPDHNRLSTLAREITATGLDHRAAAALDRAAEAVFAAR
jgi:hypothetical protein